MSLIYRNVSCCHSCDLPGTAGGGGGGGARITQKTCSRPFVVCGVALYRMALCGAVLCSAVLRCEYVRGILSAGGCWRTERKGAPRVPSTGRAGTATRKRSAGSCATGDKSGRSVP